MNQFFCDSCGEPAIVLARNVFLCRACLIKFAKKASAVRGKMCVRCEQPKTPAHICRDISITSDELFDKLPWMKKSGG